MAYEARRNDNLDDEKATQHEANKNTAKTLAKGAGAYFGGAAGAKAVDLASKTKVGQKVLDSGAKLIDNNHMLNNASQVLNKTGAVDAADKAIGSGGLNGGSNTPNQGNKASNTGGEQNGSLPSSGSNNSDDQNKKKPSSFGGSDDDKTTEDDNKKDNPVNGIFSFLGKAAMIKIVLFLGIVVLIVGMLVSQVISMFSGVFDFIDLFGISAVTGGETGNVNYSPDDSSQQEFYERVNQVKLSFQAEGKNVDALKVVAVFHVLKNYNDSINYSTITSSQIEEVANSMFLNNQYDENTFKNNLKNNIIPKYLPGVTSTDSIVDEIFKYVSDYNDLVGSTDVNANSSSSSNCVSTDTCNYSLKGFSIFGKGNISENLNITNLYVRLMQCGIGNGHNYGGTFGKALANEELVPFEKYILGVAYHKYESGTPNEAIKAQMVADRSFILARHADLGGWRTLKKENGRWILQAASCTQDRVYCDPDKGCSSNDAEWGMVHSGLNNASGYSKQPLSESSTLRSLAKDVVGEVLANNDYVVYTNSNSTDWNKFVSLANKGYNYKQILMEVYNQGNRNYGVSKLLKASCSKTTSCQASGDYASWKQNQGPWVNVRLGSSGRTIKQIGCLATSVAILIAKSGVQTNVTPFNPGTFVEAMSKAGGFSSGGDMNYAPVSSVAPNFRYAGQVYVLGEPESQKLLTLGNLLNTGYYVVAEVKGHTGQHWVAVDSIQNGVINMMDPGTNATNMWKTYPSRNTSRFVYFKVN